MKENYGLYVLNFVSQVRTQTFEKGGGVRIQAFYKGGCES